MIVIMMVGWLSGLGERKWDVWGSVVCVVIGGYVFVKFIFIGVYVDLYLY